MKTLHKYLARQVLASLSLTVVVFTFVLMIGNLLKEVLDLLAFGHARFGLVLEAIALLVPFLWVFAFPMGLLTSTLLVFGRFSADQELTAARASGISLVSLIAPILLLSLGCCGLSACVTMKFGPESRAAYNNLIYRARHEIASVQMPEQTYIRDFPGLLFWVDKNLDGELYGVRIDKFSSDTNNPYPITTTAPRGRLEIDPTNHLMFLYLTNVNTTTIVGQHGRDTFAKTQTIAVNLNASTNQQFVAKVTDMTFAQLRNELRDQERRQYLPPAAGASKAELFQQMLLVRQQQSDWTLPIRVEMNRQISFSFASFGFALVGIPLGIRMHRRETNMGVALALGLAVVYYSFFILGESLKTRPDLYPHLILWLPNFIFQAVGGALLWRANRGL